MTLSKSEKKLIKAKVSNEHGYWTVWIWKKRLGGGKFDEATESDQSRCEAHAAIILNGRYKRKVEVLKLKLRHTLDDDDHVRLPNGYADLCSEYARAIYGKKCAEKHLDFSSMGYLY